MSGTIRILAIEDDADTRANLRDILELDGYEVDVASRVSEALNRSDWSEYAAILLDRRLPDGTAEELLPRLVKLAPGDAVVVVAGRADFEGTIAALRFGVTDYLLKPIDPGRCWQACSESCGSDSLKSGHSRQNVSQRLAR